MNTLWYSIRTHGSIEAYGGMLSIFAFGIMWASIVVPVVLGYMSIKKMDIENHRKWMVRCFGALFGSFFFWRIEALILQWIFTSANGWLFYTATSWMLGMLLFDNVARKSGFYSANIVRMESTMPIRLPQVVSRHRILMHARLTPRPLCSELY